MGGLSSYTAHPTSQGAGGPPLYPDPKEATVVHCRDTKLETSVMTKPQTLISFVCSVGFEPRPSCLPPSAVLPTPSLKDTDMDGTSSSRVCVCCFQGSLKGSASTGWNRAQLMSCMPTVCQHHSGPHLPSLLLTQRPPVKGGPGETTTCLAPDGW